MARRLTVGIAESSTPHRQILRDLCAHHGFEVVGEAHDAFMARELVVHGNPSVLILGAALLPMSGLAFLEKLMRHRPTPVIFAITREEQTPEALQALRLGAGEIARRPSRTDLVTLARFGQSLAEKVRAVAALPTQSGAPIAIRHEKAGSTSASFDSISAAAIAVGGNAGSVHTLETLLEALTPESPPVLIACATVAPCLEAYLDALRKKTSITLVRARDGAPLNPGRAYFAPEGAHLSVTRTDVKLKLTVRSDLPVHGRLPSTHVLFESVAKTLGPLGLAVLLSGHGPDGVVGLSSVRARGGRVFVESPAEARFPFAPRLALETAAASHGLGVRELTSCLASIHFIARS